MLDLPEEILHSIAVHIEADEEARGPSQACRRLHKMHLPCITLEYMNEKASATRGACIVD